MYVNGRNKLWSMKSVSLKPKASPFDNQTFGTYYSPSSRRSYKSVHCYTMQRTIGMAWHDSKNLPYQSRLLTLLIQLYDGNTKGLSMNKIKKQSHETTRPTQTLIETSCLQWKASHFGKHIDNCNKQALNLIKPHSSQELSYSPTHIYDNSLLVDYLINLISTWDLSGLIRVSDHVLYLDNSIIPIYNFIV